MKPRNQLAKFMVLIASISILITGCVTINKTEQSAEDLPTTLANLATKNNICAVTLAVIKHRKIAAIYSATGCETVLQLNSNSMFQAASLGKPVFAVAVLKLVEQGVLELDTPVVTYLPQGYFHHSNPFATNPSLADKRVNDPKLAAITARMILNHTSGLPNWAQGTLDFESDPGTAWFYSGEGYVLLQRAVETVTGQSLEQVMHTQVFKPLEMTDSSYVWNPELDQHLLPAMTATGVPIKPWHFTNPIAAATLYTSAADYANFVTHVLNNDHLLKQLTNSPVAVAPELNLSWGLGWGIERSADELVLWHWGNNPGYRAFVMASLQSGDGFVMLTNSDNGLALAEPIANKVLSDSEHKLFKFYMLRDGFAYFMCESLGFCI